MKKKNNNTKEIEFQQTYEWCNTIVEFMIQKHGETPGLKMFNETINDCRENLNLKGLKYIIKDLNEWIRDLSSNHLNELNGLLINKFGYDLSKKLDEDSIKVNQIVSKGEIENDKEYNIVLKKVESMIIDGKHEEVSELNKLLTKYHSNSNEG
ncbi:hypothetical protein FAZ19_15825 [Sphingobacterium alkalisoli]|uniref:Uncharacterized protein n=1 Tax=Sphingobacterium alkalisoli TaxID=1874115 RepID=A0A4U0GXF1_9SPHI|nr:hypothetical protein [Sphingobacterium alkalisoli]TJY63738.1 hypothetical protein FAZ19_15825 [Sphingobacterium alkalisoli]GGH25195.1 hypothetical protein GCM10011418_33650 [Sphingobacterium alkalisoli]